MDDKMILISMAVWFVSVTLLGVVFFVVPSLSDRTTSERWVKATSALCVINTLLMVSVITSPEGKTPANQLHTLSVIISEVGGCDAKGLCGVMYSDVTYGKEYYPVKGAERGDDSAFDHAGKKSKVLRGLSSAHK